MARDVAVDMELGYTVGSDNVFEDLGFDHPEEELAKAKLVMGGLGRCPTPMRS